LNRWVAARGLSRWPSFAVGVGIPTIVTFVAIGFWHGAGWSFILFGLVHAAYICINETWRELRKQRSRALRRLGRKPREPGPLAIFGYHALTLIGVAYANVMFRAGTVGDAVSIWGSMTGFDGLDIAHSAPTAGELAAIAMGAVIVFLLPNTQQIMGRFDPAYNWDEWRKTALAPIRWTWKPSPLGLTFAATALFLGVVFIERGQAVFLYFKF
ncbi:MAG TPA: hypothetical protein VHY34_06430, partial [Caulobacteraceae bacterium]|nr:hypothetical protein [Caulobacteraceae bacterium]